MNEKQKKLEEGMDLLDEMLEQHEIFKQEYGKKYANLSKDEKIKLKLKELEETYNILIQSEIKIDTKINNEIIK